MYKGKMPLNALAMICRMPAIAAIVADRLRETFLERLLEAGHCAHRNTGQYLSYHVSKYKVLDHLVDLWQLGHER